MNNINLRRRGRAVYRRAASEGKPWGMEVPSLRMRLAARPPHLRVRERACWAGMAAPDGSWKEVGVSGKVEGTIEWWRPDLGYGFLRLPGEEKGTIFLHFTSLPGTGYRNAEAGQRYSFRLEETEKGKQAVEVERL